MAKEFSGKDQRKHVRRSVGVAGKIVLPDGKHIPCEVSDISQMGALLLLEIPVPLPDEFNLEISGSVTVRRRCHKTRQEGATAGVSFPDRTDL
jgi:hypothetical protein